MPTASWAATAPNFVGGDDGADALMGDGGSDFLTGGSGADRFVLRTLADSIVSTIDRDQTLDFSLGGGDRVDLSDLDANTATGGDQAFRFIGAREFTGASGQVRFEQDPDRTRTFVFGDASAEFAVELAGLDALTADDFVL